ncbi:glycosyltransferase family 25 protein [Comamonas sp.]|uniref:glycosyltransferase family 25 protein n=1 Tax=Comamonas sp. TaxID=34028 RepID=UPI00258A138D|nr:glycosyltransferase family 25 protein [Comamonas sp.]
MQQKFEVRVISLDNQLERRKRMSHILDGVFSWKFSDAIAGEDISLDIPFYDHSRRLNIFGYDLRINEIACFLSHRALWEESVRLGKNMLIMEDDISFSFQDKNEYTVKILNSLVEKLNDSLFVRLGNSQIRKDKILIEPVDLNYHLCRFHRDPLGAFAYLISPKIAQQLIENSQKVFTPVDDYMWRGWEHGCLLLDVAPNFVFTQEDDNPSTIGDRKKPKISLLSKISREWFRFFDNKEKIKYELQAVNRFKKSIK